MLKSADITAKMSVRKMANGYVQQRNTRGRRRNGVANILSELNEGDIRALRQQAQDMLHPAAMGASPPGSSTDSSSSEELNERRSSVPSGQRRRRNALYDIGIGIDHAELQHLREQALAMHHPAAMVTTPPGAPCGGADGELRRTPRSVSMLAAAAGAMENSNLPDESSASSQGLEFSDLPAGPSHSFTVESITSAVQGQSTPFPRSPSSTDGASSHHHSSSSPSFDAITTITETDGDIFRERIARSSTRYRERRNAVCYEDSTQVFLNNIISAVMRCRQQRREAAAAEKTPKYNESD